jgi:hypothetical protein
MAITDYYRNRVSWHAPQSLIPQLQEDDQKGRIDFQQDGALHYLREVRHQYHGHFVPRILHPWICSFGELLTITISDKTRFISVQNTINNLWINLYSFQSCKALSETPNMKTSQFLMFWENYGCFLFLIFIWKSQVRSNIQNAVLNFEVVDMYSDHYAWNE